MVVIGVKRFAAVFFVASLALAALPCRALADNYRYVDDLGVIHFTNDESTIPKQYQDTVTSAGEERKKKKAKELGLRTGVIKYKDYGKGKLVPVTINGVKKNFIYDPDASSTSINHKTEAELKLTKIPGSEAVAHTPSGGLLPIYMVEVTSIQIGAVELKTITAVVNDFDDPAGEAAGILGMNDLENYEVDMDVQTKTMTIKPL